MTLGEPFRLQFQVHAFGERAHRARLIADEAMAGRKLAVRRDAEVSGPGAAGYGRCVPRRISHGVHHVGERIALSGKRAALELRPQSIISPSMTLRSEPCISALPLGALSIGEKPTLWNPASTNWSRARRSSRFAGVTVTRADTCMRRWRASNGPTLRIIASKLPLPLL